MWRSGLEFRYLLLGLGVLVLIEIGGVVDVGIAFLCSLVRLLYQLAM